MLNKNLHVDEANIRAVFEFGSEAWNRGDIDQYLAVYWNSERTRWVTGGTVIRGKEAIAPAVKARFPSPDSMGTIHITRLEINILAEPHALVFGELLSTTGDITRELVFTAHLSKIEGEWLIVSDHTSSAS